MLIASGGLRRSVSRRRGEPRLVLRFAVITAISLGAAAAALILLTRHLYTVEAERAAAHHAQYVSQSVLGHELAAVDFRRPSTGARRSELDRVLSEKVLLEGTLGVALVRPDGTIVHASDHASIGRPAPRPDRVRDALAGTITSATSFAEVGSSGPVKSLESYVPVVAGGQTAGVAVITQDYAPIAAAARAAFLPVTGIAEGVVVVLFVFLVPMLARAARRLRRQLDEIEQLAYQDDLTGLPNRRAFLAEARRAIDGEPEEQVGVILVDLDRFKEVNDTLGHGAGDVLLRELSTRLREAVPAGATLARLGGDEFAVVIPGSPNAVAALATQLQELLGEPLGLGETTVSLEASLGIATYPTDGTDPEALLRAADVAMYLAKGERSGIAAYDPARDENDTARLTLMAELKRALEQREIIPHYQVIAELGTGAVCGAECLARWMHPERGLLPPSEFLPFMERTGLRGGLTRLILERATDQLVKWDELGITVPLAVNLTMHDLLDDELPDRVDAALESAGIAPDRLELEITESALMTDPDRVHSVLARLHTLGLTLAIDDFGTGYSSLAYLRDLPVDILKLDRSFTLGVELASGGREIVRAVTTLAHTLGLRVIAEGVETQAAWDALRELGCDAAQGYFIGRPADAETTTGRLLAAGAVVRAA